MVIYTGKGPSIILWLQWQLKSAMASQITGTTPGYSTACSGQHQTKHQKFLITGLLWGKSTHDMWIPHTKGQ